MRIINHGKHRYYSLENKIIIREGDMIVVQSSPIFLLKSIGKTVGEFKLVANYTREVYRRYRED